MKSLANEKYDHADTAFLMYENALRKTDKLMDELKPDDIPLKDAYSAKLLNVRNGLHHLDLEEEEKPTKSSRSRNKNKKKSAAASQKSDIKMEPLYKDKIEYLPEQALPLEEEVTCPCGQNKNDDWVGCDMHEK